MAVTVWRWLSQNLYIGDSCHKTFIKWRKLSGSFAFLKRSQKNFNENPFRFLENRFYWTARLHSSEEGDSLSSASSSSDHHLLSHRSGSIIDDIHQPSRWHSLCMQNSALLSHKRAKASSS